MAQNMGIGKIGDADIVFKRKFRYTFKIYGFCNGKVGNNIIPEHFVLTAGRPNLSIEELEINHLNAKTWIPGKASWEELSVTYVDVAHSDGQAMYNWLATTYDFSDPATLRQGNKIDWDSTGLLTLYDGTGEMLETWEMKHLWPKAINFGDVDYSSNDNCTIELTCRYSDVTYKSYCPQFDPEGCYTPCG